jgi:hypothetical protein
MKDTYTQPYGKPEEDTMKRRYANRRTIMGIVAFACLGIGLAVYGFGSMSNIPGTPPMAERTDTMYATHKNPASNRGILPIDASAPARTETATFALG